MPHCKKHENYKLVSGSIDIKSNIHHSHAKQLKTTCQIKWTDSGTENYQHFSQSTDAGYVTWWRKRRLTQSHCSRKVLLKRSQGSGWADWSESSCHFWVIPLSQRGHGEKPQLKIASIVFCQSLNASAPTQTVSEWKKRGSSVQITLNYSACDSRGLQYSLGTCASTVCLQLFKASLISCF